MSDGLLAQPGVSVMVKVNGVRIDLPPATLQAAKASIDEAVRKADQIALALDRLFLSAHRHISVATEPQENT